MIAARSCTNMWKLTETLGITLEAWLPTNWTGRFSSK